jgi:uncharacterized membrane protein
MCVVLCLPAGARDAPDRTLRYRVVETGIQLVNSDLRTAISNRGDIAVTLLTADGQPRAAHWRAGRLTLLGDAAGGSYVTGVNDCGVVSGVSARGQVIWTTLGPSRETVLLPGPQPRPINVSPINNRGEVVVASACGFGLGSCLSLWRQGTLRDLGVAQFDRLLLDNLNFQLNDRGEVAAMAVVRDRPGVPSRRAALVWKDGSYRELEPPQVPGQISSIAGLNNRGLVVGSVAAGDPPRPQWFKWVDGVPQALPTPAGSDAFVYGLNDRGDAVGFVVGTDTLYAALWRDGLVNLNDVVRLKPAEEIIVATDINDRGWIVAEVMANREPPTRVVILKPVRGPGEDQIKHRQAGCRQSGERPAAAGPDDLEDTVEAKDD